MGHPQRIGSDPRDDVRAHGGRISFMRLVLVILLLGGAIFLQTSHAARAMTIRSTAKPEVTPVPGPMLRLLDATDTPTVLESLEQQLDAAWNAQDWALAVSLIEQIIAIDDDYDDIQSRYYFAYVNWGYQLLTNGQCADSQAKFRRALEIRPGGEEAQTGLDVAARYCVTPTPGPTTTGTVIETPTEAPPGVPSATPTPEILSGPITYTVQAGDTLYSLAKRYNTTVQAIMQANGMMDYFVRAGTTIVIPAGGTQAPGPLVHIVQPGETLTDIARQYNTTVWAIMAMNGMASPTIWAYRALYIPSAMQTGPIIHIVMPGDTLNMIAERWATTVPLIMLANDLSGYEIYVYQKLIIPPQGWTGWPPLVPGMGAGGQPLHSKTYVVQHGDTLFSISRRFGITVAALKAANGLSDNHIVAGQTLRIP